MASSLTINYSNRLERLYVGLRDRLFGEGGGPFDERWVIVPTHAIKSWLQQRLAEDPAVGVAAGIEFLFLEEAVGRWVGGVAPDRLAMSLQIELLLQAGVKEGRAGWEPVISYLKPKRIGGLAAHLSELFVQYSLYGHQMLESWTGWQADLWNAGGWRSLAGELGRVVATPIDEGQVHLFGFSHLAPAYDRFFKRLGKVMPVNYHVLSPCQAYWGDVKSDRERCYLNRLLRGKGAREGELDQLDAILRDSNSLIANLGRLGREYFLLLEDGEAESEEDYVAPDDGTLLGAIQGDLLLLNPASERGLVEMGRDQSVQIHIATSRWREVEVLHNALLALLDGKEISPGEVVVMAPDIGEYAPFIETVFCGEIPFQLHDLRATEVGSLLDGFTKLLDLATGRWRVSKVLALFEHPTFLRRVNWMDDELRQVRKWIQRTGVRWGFDVAHRDEQLANAYGKPGMLERSAATTWEGGVNLLLESLASDDSADPLVELSQADLLGSLIGLLESLRKDLRLLQGSATMSLSDWCDSLEALGEAYLRLDGESVTSVTDRLRRLDCEEALSFVTVGRLIETILEEKSSTRHGHQIDAVRFCSMLPMRAIPSKVVCLLGVDQGAFPRVGRKRPFDEMSGRDDVDRLPGRSDVDRYLFLEALLSARDHLLIFYQGVGEGDGQPQGPSAVVDELLGYADRAFRLNGELPSEACVRRHPHLSCHSSYFADPVTNYNRLDYLRAVALYRGADVGPAAPMEPQMVLQDGASVVEIDIGDLRATASDPCRFYLRRALGMTIDEEWADGISDDESLMLSALEQHRMVWEALARPVEEVLEEAATTGRLPLGPFRDVARDRLLQSVAEHEERLESYGIAKDSLVTVRLSDGTAQSDRELVVPPVEVEVREGLTARITGEIPFVSPEGLFLSGRAEAGPALRGWPLLLVMNEALPKNYKRQLLFSRVSKRLELEGGGSDLLRSYIDYHLTCSENLSPLLPRWLPDYLGGNVDALTKRIEAESGGGRGPYLSPYARWTIERAGEEIHPVWTQVFEGAFAVPVKCWFGGDE